MGALVSFFSGPAQLKALLAGAAVAAIACLALLSAALWYRGEALDARAEVRVKQAQVDVLADSARRCSEATADTKRSGEAALAAGRELVALARVMHQGTPAAIAGLEERLRQKPPAGAGCAEAWASIETDYKATRGSR